MKNRIPERILIDTLPEAFIGAKVEVIDENSDYYQQTGEIADNDRDGFIVVYLDTRGHEEFKFELSELKVLTGFGVFGV